MANIHAKIKTILDTLGYPVRAQGTYNPGESLPETHVTYQIIDAPNNSHADNIPTSTTWRIQVTLYSKKPSITQSADALIKAALIPEGFTRVSGRDYPYNAETGHNGFTTDYRYYETEV